MDRLEYTKKTLIIKMIHEMLLKGIIGLLPQVTFWGVPFFCMAWQLDLCVKFAVGLLWKRAHNGDRHVSRRRGLPNGAGKVLLGKYSRISPSKHSMERSWKAVRDFLIYACPGSSPPLDLSYQTWVRVWPRQFKRQRQRY